MRNLITVFKQKEVKSQSQKEEDELLGELNSNEGEDEYHSILDNNVPSKICYNYALI